MRKVMSHILPGLRDTDNKVTVGIHILFSIDYIKMSKYFYPDSKDLKIYKRFNYYDLSQQNKSNYM